MRPLTADGPKNAGTFLPAFQNWKWVRTVLRSLGSWVRTETADPEKDEYGLSFKLVDSYPETSWLLKSFKPALVCQQHN